MSFIADWGHLRQRVRDAPARARELDDEITAALYRYRIHLTRLSIKPHRLDRQIWDSYDSILAEIRKLRADSDDRLMRSVSKLRALLERWEAVFERQKRFVNLVTDTIERSDFYNKMETAKDDLSRERQKDAQLQARLSSARRGLIQALHYLLLREKSGEGITSGSIVLDLDLAIDSWEQGVSEILALQATGELEPEEEMRVLDSLRQCIVDAPRWAERLKKLEGELDDLLGLEDQLRNMTGSGQLSEIELSEMLDLLRVEAREYWAESNWEGLEEAIDSVQAYVSRESRPLQSQLYVLRKRRGHAPPVQQAREPSGANPDPNMAQSKVNEPAARAENAVEISNGLYDGSLRNAIGDREINSQDKTTFVDPDADESVRSVFEGRRSQSRRQSEA